MTLNFNLVLHCEFKEESLGAEISSCTAYRCQSANREHSGVIPSLVGVMEDGFLAKKNKLAKTGLRS